MSYIYSTRTGPSKAGQSCAEWFTNLSKQGWELVTYVKDGNRYKDLLGGCWVFKRKRRSDEV